jgi:hypothetical protein
VVILFLYLTLLSYNKCYYLYPKQGFNKGHVEVYRALVDELQFNSIKSSETPINSNNHKAIQEAIVNKCSMMIMSWQGLIRVLNKRVKLWQDLLENSETGTSLFSKLFKGV